MPRFAIIGAGASALAAAITIKRDLPNSVVTVYEKLPRAGKKILATGNGRCNLSNEAMGPEFYHGDNKIIESVLGGFDTKDCLAFFESLGLKTMSESGRVYPMSMNATSVLDVLRFECEKLGVTILCDTPVSSLERTGASFTINTQNTFDYVLLASGGKAAASQGTSGDSYKLLKSLGITHTDLFPALVQVRVRETLVKQLKGIRVRGNISIDGLSESGEILFTDYGLSGIATMQLAGEIAERTKNGNEVLVAIDLCHSMTEAELYKYIVSISSKDLLVGIMNKQIAKVVLKISKNDKELVNNIKHFCLHATGTNDFKDAQVTRGGVPSVELSNGSLESKKVPGLFLCGEVLDVDGTCGGYNLHFAWGSGIKAAKEAVKLASNK